MLLQGRRVCAKRDLDSLRKTMIRRPLGQGVSELLLGGGFTSPYPLRLDPGASRAALPMAISLCLSRKSRSLGPENAQNVGAKGGGPLPGWPWPFPSPGGRNGTRILHPALTPHPRRMSFPGTHFPPQGEGKGQSQAVSTARDLPFSPEGEGECLQDARILLG